ncbi:hypothetical protein DVH24_037768 [Malus domestica]|uniref:Uncharacterized protein n=1 Tax=Malus domestica TaxID=3750 RepID=A0A498JWD5_MALDO|nr:hypothetical protein DVH24_037768 [Malus domestica]
MGRCILTLTRVILEGEYQDSIPLDGAKFGKLNVHLKWNAQPIYHRCSWPDVTIGEALVGWWRGFVLVGMLGGGCCSRSLGFLWLYFMAWAFTVYWNYWASMAESFGLVY